MFVRSFVVDVRTIEREQKQARLEAGVLLLGLRDEGDVGRALGLHRGGLGVVLLGLGHVVEPAAVCARHAQNTTHNTPTRFVVSA